MKLRQNYIRKELQEVEKKIAEYHSWLVYHNAVSSQSYWYEMSLDLFQFLMARRRFFLKDLLKAQIKEFDRD